MKVYIERCLNAGSLSLTHLERIEQKLLEDFEFSAFYTMGHGTFLEFLLSEAKQVSWNISLVTKSISIVTK